MNLASQSPIYSAVYHVRRSGDLISLLDEQCAHANRAAGSVVAAYDVMYLPMDFR